jgi:hypothetical protein
MSLEDLVWLFDRWVYYMASRRHPQDWRLARSALAGAGRGGPIVPRHGSGRATLARDGRTGAAFAQRRRRRPEAVITAVRELFREEPAVRLV